MKRLLVAGAALAALLAASSAEAAPGNRLRLIYIRPAGGLPANQTLNIGSKTPAGYGGCNSVGGGGSVAFMNITYTGTHASSLVFDATGTKTSQDTRLKIDGHNCVVPNGTYGGTPTLAVTTATYVITDQNGATGNLNVVAVPNRFDVTNIDPISLATGSISTAGGGTVTFTTNPGTLVVGQFIGAASGVSAGTHITAITNQWNGTNAVASVTPSQAVASKTLFLSDGDNPDTGSCTAGATCTTIATQIRTLMERTPASGGPASGDSIYIRCGAVVDPPFWDRITTANAPNGITTPGDLRIVRAADSGIEAAMNPYTAITVPSANWINVTADTAGCGTIRHALISGAAEPVLGYRFTGLNFEMDYNGTNGFAPGIAELVLGTGSSSQSYVQIDNNTFQGKTTVPAGQQRGQQGIFSVTKVGDGSSGCSSATIAFFDNWTSSGTSAPSNGEGAAYHASIVGGAISQWIKDTDGHNYTAFNTQHEGGVSAGQPGTQGYTFATVTGTGCSTTPTATPNMNGLDIVTGISGAGTVGGVGTREAYIHDNTFTGLWDGMNLVGNQNSVDYTVPTNFWIIGNTCDTVWNICRQFSSATPIYSRWNFTKNMKYASGQYHNDDEIRLFSTLVNGKTYPFGDLIGNIFVRGSGLDNGNTYYPNGAWADAQGWFSSNVPSGKVATGKIDNGSGGAGTTVTFTTDPGTLLVNQNVTGSGVTASTRITGGISQWNGSQATATVNNSQNVPSKSLTVTGIALTGCLAEGNIYVGVFANALTFLDCTDDALAAFNTLVQDPVANVLNPNEKGITGSSNPPLISKYSASITINGTSAYNAVASTVGVWTGGSPTVTCNVTNLGKGDSSPSANAYAAPPSNWATGVQTVAAVQAAFQPKSSGTLTPAGRSNPNCETGGTPALYNAGTGGYFDYVNRVATPPF